MSIFLRRLKMRIEENNKIEDVGQVGYDRGNDPTRSRLIHIIEDRVRKV